jgi:hypothetical protein
MSLCEVGATVEGRQVAWKCELAGGSNLIADSDLRGTTPADHDVSDVGYRRAANRNAVRLDERFRPARGRPAVVGDVPGDDCDLTRERGGSCWHLWVDSRQLGSTDREQRHGYRQRDDGWTKQDGRGDAGQRKRDGDGSDERLRWGQHDGGGQGNTPGQGKD